MKYWCNDYDTYAAETIDDMKAEQIAMGVIDENGWDINEWSECDGNKKMWVLPLEDIDRNRMKTDIEYKNKVERECLKTLDEVFNSPEWKPISETGKAWFMCSTEW